MQQRALLCTCIWRFSGYAEPLIRLRSVHSDALRAHQQIEAMTSENRIMQMTGTRAKKASAQLASCTSASSPLKRLVPVSTPKCVKGSFAKSSSTSSSDSGCGKRSGNAIFNRKMSQGAKGALEHAKLSTSECSTETTSTEFEASNELSLKCVEPDETKCIIDVADPDPGLQSKELDVLHSNLAVNWFSLDDHEFDHFLKIKTDQNPDMMDSEKQSSLSSAAKAADSPDSVPDGTNNGHNDECQGTDCREYSITTSRHDKKFEEGKVVEEELGIRTPDVQEWSKSKNNCHKYENEPALSEKSEGTSEANAQQDTTHAKTSGNLPRLEVHGIDAFRGWLCSKVLLSSLFVLLSVWFSVGIFIEDEMVPPPT